MLILDTHALIWWLTDAGHLSLRARAAIAEQSEDVAITSASLYECVYKHLLGRLPVDMAAELPPLLRRSRFRVLDMTANVAMRAGRLTAKHRDPWDRIIAAHGIEAGCPIVTADPAIATLGAKTLW